MLIVGGSSLLGYKLSKISNEYEVYSTFHKNQIDLENIKMININICDKKSCEKILELLKEHKAAWPFKEPVKREEVPDYYDIIKEPIDLSKIGQNLKNGKYTTKQLFEKDVFLIF